MMSHRLDNGFLLSKKIIHTKTKSLISFFHYYNDHGLAFRIMLVIFHLKNFIHAYNRNYAATQMNDLFGLYQFDLIECNIFDRINISKRNRIFFFSNFYHKCLNNGKGQWKLDRKGTSLAFYGLRLNAST